MEPRECAWVCALEQPSAPPLEINTGIGISLGMLLGLVIGARIKKEGHSEDSGEKE